MTQEERPPFDGRLGGDGHFSQWWSAGRRHLSHSWQKRRRAKLKRVNDTVEDSSRTGDRKTPSRRHPPFDRSYCLRTKVSAISCTTDSTAGRHVDIHLVNHAMLSFFDLLQDLVSM